MRDSTKHLQKRFYASERKASVTYSCEDVQPVITTNGKYPNKATTQIVLKTTIKTHSIAIRRAKNGSVKIASSGNLKVHPYYNVSHIVSRMDEEMLDFFHEVLNKWGYEDYAPPTEQDLRHPEETFPNDAIRDKSIQLSCQLMTACCPVGSYVMKTHLYDPFYDMGLKFYHNASFWYAKDLKSFCYQGYGFYRKDLAKLVMTSTEEVVNWIGMFKGYLTPDQTVRAFQSLQDGIDPDDIPALDRGDLCQFLKFFSHPTSRFNLATLRQTDTISMDFASIDALRTSLSFVKSNGTLCFSQKIQGWAHLGSILEKIVVKDSPKRLIDPLTLPYYKGYDVAMLSSVGDYLYTSKTMRNCIGEAKYALDAKNGVAKHIRFDKNETPVALLELRRKNLTNTFHISQIRGLDNKTVDDDKFNRESLLRWLNKCLPAIKIN